MRKFLCSFESTGLARSFMRRFARLAGEAGASLMEYALLVSLIAVVCIASIQAFRGETTKIFVNVASQLP